MLICIWTDLFHVVCHYTQGYSSSWIRSLGLYRSRCSYRADLHSHWHIVVSPRYLSESEYWTGEFDLNTLCVDGEILNPERKSCGFKNIRIRISTVYYLSAVAKMKTIIWTQDSHSYWKQYSENKSLLLRLKLLENIQKIPNEFKTFIYQKIPLKWYYDQKIISFFSSDFESVFAKHPTGKILSFVFIQRLFILSVSFGFQGPPLLTFKTDR